jgi:hypothetical protein
MEECDRVALAYVCQISNVYLAEANAREEAYKRMLLTTEQLRQRRDRAVFNYKLVRHRADRCIESAVSVAHTVHRRKLEPQVRTGAS